MQEPPAELRARAQRFRKLALEFPVDMRAAILELAEELEATAAARLEAPPA